MVIKLGVRHAKKEALILFSREIAQAATGMAPGLTGIVGGRPTVYPVIRLFSFLVDKAACALAVEIDRAEPEGALGTIAGDDCIFVACTSPASARQLAAQLMELSAGAVRA